MAKLTQNDFTILAKYIEPNLLDRWTGIEKKSVSENNITIANTGLFSSGKSQLFNALIDRTEDERFPVGTIPTTKIGDRERFSDRIELIDTPGIDANSEDDEMAFKMLVESDIILVTHNVKTGMLGRAEYEWIRSIASGMPEEERTKRIIFVATWIDAITDEVDYKKTIEEIKRQLFDATGVELIFWEVSSKRYYSAKKKNNDVLEKKSNIPGFRQFLVDYANNYEKESAIEKEIIIMSDETLSVLSEQAENLKKSITSIEKKHQKKAKERTSLWKSKLDRFKSMRSGVEGKLNKIKNEDNSSSFSSFKSSIMNM